MGASLSKECPASLHDGLQEDRSERVAHRGLLHPLMDEGLHLFLFQVPRGRVIILPFVALWVFGGGFKTPGGSIGALFSTDDEVDISEGVPF